MTNQTSTKVRLVRCPNCRQVLAELPDVLLYQCGGCGTVLQAKNRKQETNRAESSSQEIDSVAESQQNNVLEEEEANPPGSKSSTDKENLRCQEENGNSSMELCEERSVSENLSSSPEVDCPQVSPIEVEESWKQHDPLSLGRSSGSKRYYSKFSDDNGEWNRSRNFSNEFYSSDEFTHEAEEYASEESEHTEKQSKIHLNQENGIDETGSNENDESVLPPDGENREGITNTSSDIVSHENAVDDGVHEGEDMHAMVDDSIIASQSPLNESLVSVYFTSPEDEHVNHSMREETHKFGRVSSVDTMASSDLNFKHQSMSKFPTSGSYYGYDGSESSYDGTDYQISENIPYRLRNGKDMDYVTPTERVTSSHWSQEKHSRTVNSSSYRHNLLPPRPGFNRSSYAEPDKEDLLRTVCELKDQLNRMQFSTVAPKNRFSPFHYDHASPQREIYADYLNVCAKRSNVPRTGFSGCRQQASCSCLHCCPQEWSYSAQLPSHCTHCTNSHYNSSNSSSPRHYARHDERKRFHLKEKAKRHLRPIAGGPPFVACYHCWELLQLPADFLFFKKRYHQLKCNGCKKVLKFSLKEGSQLVPYLPGASAPPPSEIDDCDDANTRRKNLDRRSAPVSYSDDYGKAYNGKMSSFSSSEPVEDRKMKSVMKEPDNRKTVKSFESVGSTSKVQNWIGGTSEIEEVPMSSNSPLHRLMGYSSPSQVLK